MTGEVLSKKINPLRKCIACQEMRPKTDLIRVVKLPDGVVAVDETGKMDGRGAYICKNKTCIELARKNSSLNRSLKARLKEDIWEEILVRSLD